ncbi:hypothetical protein Tcan_00918, partial [Toxocara canis]
MYWAFITLLYVLVGSPYLPSPIAIYFNTDYVNRYAMSCLLIYSSEFCLLRYRKMLSYLRSECMNRALKKAPWTKSLSDKCLFRLLRMEASTAIRGSECLNGPDKKWW